MFLLRERALCVHNPFERKRLCQERSNLAILDIGNKVWKNRLVPRGATNHCEILEIEGAHIKRYEWTADRTR